MALPKCLVLYFIFASPWLLSDPGVVTGEVIGAATGTSDDSLEDTAQNLKTQISFIASKANEREQELKSKEDILTELQGHILLAEVYSLQEEIVAQNKKKDALKAQVAITKRYVEDLLLKLANLQRTSNEKRSRILSTQHALQVAEEEPMKVKLEDASISKQPIEVCEDWIPHWQAVHVDNFQSFVISNWKKVGPPGLDLTKEALEKKIKFEEWLRSHVDTLKSHLHTFSNMAIDKYHVSKEEVKKFMDQNANHFLLLVEKVVALHRQVQAMLLDMLKGDHLTSDLVKEGPIWYMATALMVLPFFLLFPAVFA